jgi:hypothetical protein
MSRRLEGQLEVSRVHKVPRPGPVARGVARWQRAPETTSMPARMETSTAKMPAATGASMEEGETGIRWTMPVRATRPGRPPRARVSPESRQLKPRNNAPTLGRKLRPFLANKWITWIDRPVPVRKASDEPPSNASMNAAADGRVAEVAGRREVAAAAWVGDEDKHAS